MFSFKLSQALLAVEMGILSTGMAFAQTCTEPAAASFRVTTLVAPGTTTANPLYESGKYGAVGMSIAPDGNVFVAMMSSGHVEVYQPATNSVQLAGTIRTYVNGEDGLLGIALDPNFASNHWVYLLYSDSATSGSTRGCWISRFTYNSSLAANSQLTNRKQILWFKRDSDTHHAAGNMSFDGNGVLVIGTGDNTDPANSNNGGYGPVYYPTLTADAQRTASNTNDLRGKILRVKPIQFDDSQTPAIGIGTSYDIPQGNLWEKINNSSFNPTWNNGTDSINAVRKEIYTFGHRNPYHPRVDTRSGWIFWGEVGPDAGTDNTTRGPSGHDEYNLATGGGFYGHPYCNGYNVPYGSLTAPSTTYGSKYDCLETGSSSLTPLVNLSPNNTGIHHMPPAIPALATYTSGNSNDDDPRFNTTYSLTTIQHSAETAIGGPMYRYDPGSTSAIKFPPFYEGKIFFFDWDRRSFRLIKLRPDGTLPKGDTGVTNFAPNGFTTASYLDMQFGPDGALYALRNCSNAYGTGNSDGGLYRIEYTGSYDNTCYQPFNVTVLGPGATQTTALQHREIRKAIPPVMADGLLILPAGYSTVELYNVSGRVIWTFHREVSQEASRIQLPSTLGQGIWQAKLIP